MGFTLTFIEAFYQSIKFGAPLLVGLILLIILLGQVVGSIEGWKPSESAYWSFITATTVGYGDFRPTKGICQLLAVVIAINGLILFGIVVAVAVHATTIAAQKHIDLASIAPLYN